MRRNVYATALIAIVGLARIPEASAISVITPPPPPVCSTSLDTEPLAQLFAQIKKGGTPFLEEQVPECVGNALRHRGDAAVPGLIALMNTRKVTPESLGLYALCGPDHKDTTALPYVERRLLEDDPVFDQLAFPVLVCLGDVARPVIPILMRKSLALGKESEAAISTLGELAQYDPGRIIPHLVRLLDQPAHMGDAAIALENDGAVARAAQEPLIKKITVAIAKHQGDRAATLINALKSVGEPGRMSEVLSSLLQHPEQMDAYSRIAALEALFSVAPQSLATLREILNEGVKGEAYNHFETLANINPFPEELTPALFSGMHQMKDVRDFGWVLRKALANTHTDLQSGQPVPKPTHDVSVPLAAGLMALVQQSRPLTAADFMEQLHLDPTRFDDQGDALVRRLSRKPEPDLTPPETDVIDSIVLSETEQEFDVTLRAGYCISHEAMNAPASITVQESEPLTITVSALKRHWPPSLIQFMRPDIKNRCDLVDIGYGCDNHVRIVKTFKDDARCAWLPDHEPYSGPLD